MVYRSLNEYGKSLPRYAKKTDDELEETAMNGNSSCLLEALLEVNTLLEAVRSSSFNTSKQIWNQLPEEVAGIPDPVRFKNAAKTFIVTTPSLRNE
uniref:Uncharacterized protein n=1 Tax=Acrobeloides nanus TaxID=290746 RepID=A0A914BVN7_9BILA